MIKVLGKALGIIELVALASPQPVPPGKLAEKLGINTATCSRIIKDLVDDGYLMQVSRLAGYTLGARAFALKLQISYKNDLIDLAEPLIKACAQEIGESVLLAEICARQRYILVHHNFNPAMNIDLNQISYDDLCSTATGILLLAHLSWKECEKIMKSSGSGKLLEALRGKSRLPEFFENVRKEGYIVYNGVAHHLAVAAFPVFKDGKFIAALGASALKPDFEQEHKKNVLRELKNCADKISTALSAITTLG